MLGRSKYSFLLRPLACLYGLGVAVRNFFFDQNILKSRSYPIPIICVGNITLGGTGKTPHVEYILSRLCPHFRVAVLSRGYKRRSRGQVIATAQSTVIEIGDEPRQLKLKYPEIILVVDGNRRRAMDYLMKLPKDQRPDVVVMDDGFQHRYVKPSYSILLVDSERQLQDDRLIPEGRLREPAYARYRADCIIATKCPTTLSPIEQRLIERNLAPYPHQRMFFSRIGYQPLRTLASLLDHTADPTGLMLMQDTPVVTVSGIARPEPFIEYTRDHYHHIESFLFPDHHNFAPGDIVRMNKAYEMLSTQSPGLRFVCTEKDAVRLTEYHNLLSAELFEAFCYLPIEIEVLHGGSELDRMLMLAAKAKPASLQIK